MRLKSLLLLVFIAQVFCGSVFAQATTIEDSWPSKTREDNSILLDKMDSRKSIFYSNAKMYVAKSEVATDATSIFIQGTAKFDDAAEISQVGELALTGDFVSLKNPATLPSLLSPLFNQATNEGVVKFVGLWNSQYIVRENLAGVPYLNTLDNAGKVGANNQFVLEFPNVKVAKEGITSVTTGAVGGIPNPLPPDPSINRPATSYDVEKMGFVSVASNVAMSAEKLDITGGNRFSIDVTSDGLEQNAQAVPGIGSADYYKLNSAYVDIKSMETTGVPGHSEVNMRMYAYDSNVDNAQELGIGTNLKDEDLQKTNTVPVVLAGGAARHATFMRGFTSPFEKLKADYMFYNVLTRPSATSVTDWRNPVASPHTDIESGVGYFMAMDVSRAYFEGGDESIQKRWHPGNPSIPASLTSYKLRARGGYNLSRVVQRINDTKPEHDNAWFSLYTFDPTDTSTPNPAPAAKSQPRIYEEQRFNVGEVKVKVAGGNADQGGGLNFLGNPFMMPIDLSGLLAKNDYNGVYDLPTTNLTLSNPDMVQSYQPFEDVAKVKAVHFWNQAAFNAAQTAGDLLLRSKYWVVTTALVANTQIGGVPSYAYSVKYDNVVAITEGPTIPDAFSFHIEPMQMFLVQAATSGEFVFNQKMKTFKKEAIPIVFYTPEVVPETGGPRSTRIAEQNEDKFIPNDWLIVEAIAGNGGKTSVDRTAVRFFDQATQGLDNLHDDKKKFLEPSTSATRTRLASSDENYVETNGSSSNFVYTTATSGEKLMSNGVGYDTKEIPLYYISDGEVQNVTFAITGIEGFDRVSSVSLVDRFVNGDGTEFVKKISDTDFTYEFTTIPGKETIDGENRFALRFGDDDDNGGSSEVGNLDPITCYYSGSALHIGGLNEKDKGSKVQIFDLQGRMMGSTIVNDAPTMIYQKPLGQGTFIVNIIGERNYKTKFVNLQNY